MMAQKWFATRIRVLHHRPTVHSDNGGEMRHEGLSQGSGHQYQHLISNAGTSLTTVNNQWPPASNIDDLRSRRRAKIERLKTEREANSAIRDDPALRNHIDNGRSRTTADNVRSWLESEEEGGAGSVGGPMGASVAGALT
jgi:hypothetical protein